MDCGPFFERPRPVGMPLDHGAVPRHRFQLDPHDLLSLQLFEDPVQHAILRSAMHPQVDGAPFAKPIREAASFAAMFDHIQHGVEHWRVRPPDIATLHRKVRCNAFVLCFVSCIRS